MYGAKIQTIRLARGYTQDYVAKKSGVLQSVLSNIEKNEEKKVTDVTLEKIAEVMGVSIEDLKNPTPIVMSFRNNWHNEDSRGGGGIFLVMNYLKF